MLGIEKELKRDSESAYFSKYDLMRKELLGKVYPFWVSGFPGGNDHGPEHIKRVLAYLNKLLDGNPVSKRLLNVYELFLTMMAILYHDVGILRSRKNHANISNFILQEENNTYIFDKHDREIIGAAVVSHSSTQDINEVCSNLDLTEEIAGNTVRPRVIAALVRLADEIDEDYRRAPEQVEAILNLPAESKFYWHFCQNITGVNPELRLKKITFNIDFRDSDIDESFQIDGTKRPFFSLFAEKIAKINRERIVVNQYLPEELQYEFLVTKAKVIGSDNKRGKIREFIFNDYTTYSEFMAIFPEFTVDKYNTYMTRALGYIKNDNLNEAEDILDNLEEISKDLPVYIQLRVLYDKACIGSLRASRISTRSEQYRNHITKGFEYIQRWISLGLSGVWKQIGETDYNAIFRFSRDNDLECLIKKCYSKIVKLLPKELQLALNKPTGSTGGGGGSGCVPLGTLISIPTGSVRIEELREGDEILSVALEDDNRKIVARIEKMHFARVPKCVRLNDEFVFSTSQPLYRDSKKWVHAGHIEVGDQILDLNMNPILVTRIEELYDYFEVYVISTADISHNFISYGIICHNAAYKMQLS